MQFKIPNAGTDLKMKCTLATNKEKLSWREEEEGEKKWAEDFSTPLLQNYSLSLMKYLLYSWFQWSNIKKKKINGFSLEFCDLGFFISKTNEYFMRSKSWKLKCKNA